MLSLCSWSSATRSVGPTPQAIRALIFSRIFSLAVIVSGRQSSNVSLQSPPCKRNRSPRAASANSAPPAIGEAGGVDEAVDAAEALGLGKDDPDQKKALTLAQLQLRNAKERRRKDI